MSQHKYNIYPSLLDAFCDMQNAEEIWLKYWGNSENPSISLEDYLVKSENDFFDKVNRVPHPPIEAADKGTAFNEVVDSILHRTPSKTVQMERIYTDNKITGVRAMLNGFTFEFPFSLVMDFVEYYHGGFSQVFTAAILPTARGDVRLYGYIDELMPFCVHDIKTTRSYEPYKFKNHWQHIVYPYCLNQIGCAVKRFEYNITDFKEVYTESYIYDDERDTKRLQEVVESLIDYLEANRDRITDKKIFNQE